MKKSTWKNIGLFYSNISCHMDLPDRDQNRKKQETAEKMFLVHH